MLFSRIRLLTLYRGAPAISRSDLNNIVDGIDENLSVTDVARSGGVCGRLDQLIDQLIGEWSVNLSLSLDFLRLGYYVFHRSGCAGRQQ